MNYNELLPKIEEHRLVPVVKLDHIQDAKPLCNALCEGGLPVAEITFRTDAAEESIRIVSQAFPDMLVGAGTIINVAQAERAIHAGAQFLVSPGISRSVIEYALKQHVPILPGTCTPSEIMIALEYDLPVVKFFPAMQYGGLSTIKALSAPYPSLRFMPTGGVSSDNLMDFLAFPKIIACGGSWMVKDSFIQEQDFDAVRTLTMKAVQQIRQEGSR